MSAESCPKCGSTSFYHASDTGVDECLKCGHKWKKPTMKELMKGEVLDGFVEAQRVKPLTEFTGGEKFWTDIDVQIEDETKAYDEYRRLAREAEQLGIAGGSWLDDIAVDEARHKETLLAIKRHYLK